MTVTQHDLTRQQAQAQLDSTRRAALGSAHDRHLHAAYTAVAGVAGASFLSARVIVSGVEGAALTAAFFSVMFAMAWWVERSARTEPWRWRVTSRIGIGASLTLAVAAVMPWLYLTPATWIKVVAGSAAAGLPALVAASVIAGRRNYAPEACAVRRLDEALSAPVRLRLVVALADVRGAKFERVRESMEVAEFTLSRHAASLQDAGYLKIRDRYAGERPRTWLSLTPAGRAACAQHLAALRDLADGE